MVYSSLEAEFLRQIKYTGLPQPEQELMFHPTRRWRFDFCFPAQKLAVEVEGGIWAQGRHTRGAGFQEDCTKYNEAVLLGWRVMRFTPGMIKSGEALRYVEMALGQAQV